MKVPLSPRASAQAAVLAPDVRRDLIELRAGRITTPHESSAMMPMGGRMSSERSFCGGPLEPKRGD